MFTIKQHFQPVSLRFWKVLLISSALTLIIIFNISSKMTIMKGEPSQFVEEKSCIHRINDCEGIFDFSRARINHQNKTKQYSTFKQIQNCMRNFQPKAKVRREDTIKPTSDGMQILTNSILKYYLLDEENIFFIELGAFDGISESNTDILEQCIVNSNGLLIDGNPIMWNKLCINRPSVDKLLFSPTCSTDYETVSFHAHQWSSAGLTNILNVSSAGLTVHCGPLTMYLNDLMIKEITIFSLDVEGAEMLVLNTINFDEIKIDIFLIEVYNRMCQENCQKRIDVRKFMKSKGYNLIISKFIFQSDVYIHSESKLCKNVKENKINDQLIDTICSNQCIKAHHDLTKLEITEVNLSCEN